eukprot:403347611
MELNYIENQKISPDLKNYQDTCDYICIDMEQLEKHQASKFHNSEKFINKTSKSNYMPQHQNQCSFEYNKSATSFCNGATNFYQVQNCGTMYKQCLVNVNHYAVECQCDVISDQKEVQVDNSDDTLKSHSSYLNQRQDGESQDLISNYSIIPLMALFLKHIVYTTIKVCKYAWETVDEDGKISITLSLDTLTEQVIEEISDDAYDAIKEGLSSIKEKIKIPQERKAEVLAQLKKNEVKKEQNQQAFCNIPNLKSRETSVYDSHYQTKGQQNYDPDENCDRKQPIVLSPISSNIEFVRQVQKQQAHYDQLSSEYKENYQSTPQLPLAHHNNPEMFINKNVSEKPTSFKKLYSKNNQNSNYLLR